MLIEAIERSGSQFDAIVVDEGQDFQSDWWVPLEMIPDKDGYFYLYYDPSQNLYVGDDFSIPNLGKPYRLPTNCRNTKRIANTCSRVRGVEIPVRKDAPEGEEALKVAKTAELQAKSC